MTTSLKKAKVGLVKGIVSPEQEGYLDIMKLPIDVANKQTTLGQVITNLLSLQATLQSVSTRIEHYRITLKAFLEKRGYEVPSDTLLDLLRQLQEVHVLNPEDKHHIALLEDEYITGIIDINLSQILKNAEIPADLENGYYKIENGKIVLDPLRKEELEGME
jgi:hypothetical protein